MIPSLPILLIAGAVLTSSAYIAGRIHGGEKIQAAWDKAKAAQVAATLEAERAARQVEAQRAAAQQEVITRAQSQAVAARRDAAAAAVAADGLRDAARAAAARCSPLDTAAAGGGPADSLADVLAELERAGRAVAAEADRAVIAGQACERAYSSLTENRP